MNRRVIGLRKYISHLTKGVFLEYIKNWHIHNKKTNNLILKMGERLEQTLHKRKPEWPWNTWKISNTSHQGNRNENHKELPFPTHWKGYKVQCSVLAKLWNTWSLYIVLVKMKMVETLWRTTWKFLRKSSTQLSTGPMSPTTCRFWPNPLHSHVAFLLPHLPCLCLTTFVFLLFFFHLKWILSN